MITILLPDLRGGGAERVNIDLAYEFLRAGHDVEFVLMQARGEFLEEARECFSVIELATPRVRTLPFMLAGYLCRRRPDAMLAAMWPLTVIAPLAQRLSGHHCSTVVSEHCVISAQYAEHGALHRILLRLSMALGYRLANHRVGVSAGVAEDMAVLSWVRRSAFDVLYNPVPSSSEPSKDEIRSAEALWSGPKGNRILTVSNLKAVKNHRLLLRAFAQLNRPDARLMIVGGGTERDALVSLSNELGISDRVILAGFHRNPTPFYKTADLFALSSDYEGFGNVIVEALACGTPVVSTDCPCGPAEILDNGRFGRLVPVNDAEALSSAIGLALDTPADPGVLKNRAADFLPEIAARKYLDLLGL